MIFGQKKSLQGDEHIANKYDISAGSGFSVSVKVGAKIPSVDPVPYAVLRIMVPNPPVSLALVREAKLPFLTKHM